MIKVVLSRAQNLKIWHLMEQAETASVRVAATRRENDPVN